jgi:penicillin-binding protein 2
MEDFLDYFYEVLVDNNILIQKSTSSTDNIKLQENSYQNDPTYLDYKNGKTSLSSFLQYAIANNWIDLSILGVGNEYYSAEELYRKLIDYTKSLLTDDSKFNKMIYRNLIFSYNLSGTEICLLLFDQGVLEYNEDDVNRLKSGNLSAYDFMFSKISSLEITPGMLALEPCSGSVVITDINTGDVLALVTYPSYDNNKFANKIDSTYYSKLLSDNAYPLNNRPLTQKLAPGSTFKMVTSFAALGEGVTTPTEHIQDLGIFEKITPAAKCHVYPSNHGSVDIIDAIKVSCNYFFYEMGWRLSIDGTGKYIPDIGLSKLQKYASLFGLNEKSGIELYEAEPQISSKDAVRSAIGQGNNAYTPAQLSRYVTTLANRGTCYNLTLLDQIKDKDGNVVLDNSATVNHDLTDIAQSTWDTVLEGMYSVVNVSGGSVEPQFRDFPITVAGKTGTSQVSRLSPNNALFLSYAPYNDPEISVTVVIPNGYTSHNAAALSKDIYSVYFGLQDASSLINGKASDQAEGGSTSLE